MAKKFAYFYFMKNVPDKIGKVVPLHVAYWKSQNLDNYSGGPFADRTGGLILFEAPDIEKAIELTDNDPFAEHDVLDRKWLKEWLKE